MKILKRRLNKKYYTKRWKDLQQYCSSRKTWPKALQEADELLDRALKKRHYKGKTMGERLVTAQHDLSENEVVWFSHKYCQKLEGIDVRTLKKKDMLRALAGFRQALRDLGALNHD